MIPNVISYTKQRSEEAKSALLELHSNQLTKRPLHSNQMTHYALELRYTSLQAYKILLKELNLPSISYLKTWTSGSLNVVKTAKNSLENVTISSDVMLLHDEIYVQRSEEYASGVSYGKDENYKFF